MTLTALNPMARLALSGAVVFAVLAAVAGASSALLTSNNVSVPDITLASGTAALQIAEDINSDGNDDDSEEYLDAIAAGPDFTGLIPGGTPATYKFFLKNNSVSSEVDLRLFADLSDFVFVPDPTDLDEFMKVGFYCEQIGDAANSAHTLSQNFLASDTGGWGTDLVPKEELFDRLDVGTDGTAIVLEKGERARCTMTAMLESDSESSGHEVTFDATFTGEQV